MTFPRLRAIGGWTFDSIVDPGELEAIDQNLARALDGFAGGVYAPSSQLEIGGSGLKVSGAFVASGTSEFNAIVNITAGGLLVAGGAAVGGGLQVVTGGLTVVAGGATITGAVAVTGATTVTGALATSGAGGTLAVSSTSTFTGLITANAGIQVNASGITCAGGVWVTTGASLFDDDVTINGITNLAGSYSLTGTGLLQEQLVATGNGRIRHRTMDVPDLAGATRTIGTASDAGTTYVGDIFKVEESSVASGILQVRNAGASTGSWMIIRTNVITSPFRLERQDGSLMVNNVGSQKLIHLVYEGTSWSLLFEGSAGGVPY